MFKVGDWVKCKGDSQFLVGLVRRVAKDGKWADVDWKISNKRMKAAILELVHELDLGGGWKIVDVDPMAGP